MRGCLGNILPKTGTSTNESFHRQLNNIINIPKCSVELIVSILGLFFINGMLITVKQMQLSIFHSYQNMKKNEKDFETFGIDTSLTEIMDIEENDKLPTTNENSTSTSILDQINAGLEQLNIDDYEKETVTCEIKGELENVSIVGPIDLLRLLRRAIQNLCVFNNSSNITQKFYLRRSFTFSSIALPLLYKDFSN